MNKPAASLLIPLLTMLLGMMSCLTSGMIMAEQAETATVDRLLQQYAMQGASAADGKNGKLLWQRTYSNGGKNSDKRSCVTCHTKDLTQYGKHVKTGKPIQPMSPAVNTERFTYSKKVNKWFKRNCKWTLGRECSAQEKADILVYLGKSTKF